MGCLAALHSMSKVKYRRVYKLEMEMEPRLANERLQVCPMRTDFTRW